MRKTNLATGEYYHIFNRGNNKQRIFYDDKDRIRFLLLLFVFQSSLCVENVSRFTSGFLKGKTINIGKLEDRIIRNRMVKLINFVFMPNHFHLTLLQVKNTGISKFMQKILQGHTKYMNLRYGTVGHIFQGPFKAVHIEDNEQLLHLSAYIHRNPRELRGWINKENRFPWSSYQDYGKENRWGEFLSAKVITNQFRTTREYRDFVDSSGTKELDESHLL